MKGALVMRRTVLAFVIFFLFTAIVLAADGDPKRAVVGVWIMGFCNAQSPAPYPLPFDCTTQVVNFHEDGTVWSSYMFDVFKSSPYGGFSVGGTGNWHYLGDNQFYVTMLRFVNDPITGKAYGLLRTDFTVETYPKSDEAITGKMVFMGYLAESAPPLPFPVVKKDPYEDSEDAIVVPGPTHIPMKRVPSFDPDSPVFQ
jgi:hypothetical protein